MCIVLISGTYYALSLLGITEKPNDHKGRPSPSNMLARSQV